jgi:hypothetical protein
MIDILDEILRKFAYSLGISKEEMDYIEESTNFVCDLDGKYNLPHIPPHKWDAFALKILELEGNPNWKEEFEEWYMEFRNIGLSLGDLK